MIKKLLKKLFPLDTPNAATHAKWEEWRINAVRDHPILYFLNWRLPIILSVAYRRYVTDPIWWIKYRIHPDHKYHIVRTGLSPNYYDTDTIMLHAIMTMVVDFVEIENKGHWMESVLAAKQDNIKRSNIEKAGKEETWEDDLMPQHQIDCIIACDDAHVWWTKRVPKREEEEVDIVSGSETEMMMFFGNGDDHDDKMKEHKDYPKFVAWRKKCEEHREQEAEWRKQETEMLQRIVAVRGSMWT